VRRLGIVGAGTMGRGIARVGLEAGFGVTLVDAVPAAVDSARAFLAGRLPADVQERLRTGTELGALTGAEAVIEAVPEDLQLKRRVFRELRELCPDALLATNTSSLSVAAIGPGVVGLHFFNPAWRLPLVEVVRAVNTPDDVVAAAVALARDLGKTPVVVPDVPGFLVNRCARPFYLEAVRIAGDGLAAPEVVDRILKAAGFPMGPFELMDLIGLDVNLAASRSVYEGFFHAPRYRPHPLHEQMVLAGRLGRKTGRGWYAYGDPDPR
jgi:3-hydroxybutyryl-CoA dehydrogenase